MNTNQDIFVMEDDKIIVDIEKFYDCLKLVKIKNIDFKVESRIFLKECIEQCKENLANNKKIVLKKANVVEWEFDSVDKFEKWLSNDVNKELGIELIS